MQKPIKLLFVINPIAGGKEKQDWETAIREFFKDSDCRIEFFIQTGKNDESSVRSHVNVLNPDIVVAVGGDGTVKLVADIIKETGIRLGIVPAGSANGLAKELGIPSDVNEAINILLNGESKKMDAIEINDKELCFHLSDVGLNAILVKHFSESKSRGLWGYGRSIFKMLWNKRKMKMLIQTDEAEVVRTAYMVLLANAEKYGTGAVINPDASVADGTFEVVVIRKIHLFEIFKAITAQKSFHPKRIEIFRTKQVTIQIQRKSPFQVDGEYMGRLKAIKARIRPGIVSVMVPKNPV